MVPSLIKIVELLVTIKDRTDFVLPTISIPSFCLTRRAAFCSSDRRRRCRQRALAASEEAVCLFNAADLRLLKIADYVKEIKTKRLHYSK